MASCNLCGASNPSPLFVKFGYRIVRCRCGLEFLDPMPTSEEIAAYYSEGYYSGDKSRRGYLDYVGDRELLTRSFHVKLDRIERLLPGRGRLLDVGAATGCFLEAAAVRGWDGVGLEVSEYACGQARAAGHQVVLGQSLEPFEGQRFDLITLWDVLEHLSDPLGFLRQARGLLSDDGILVFSTGDVGSWWSRLQGRLHRAYNPPQHLYYFTRSTMLDLCRRAGLGPARVEPDEKLTTLHYGLYIFQNLIDIAPVQSLFALLMRILPNLPMRVVLRDNLVVFSRPLAARGSLPQRLPLAATES